MNLHNSSDDQIVNNLKRIKESEDDLLIECLRHLRIVESRRIFSALKYPSLFQFVVGELGYSSDEAQRRILAARELRELPEIESKIEAGTLTLTNICMASSLFKKEKKAGKPYTKEQKLELLKQLEGKSTREAAKEIAAISPEALHRDSVRPISATQLEYKFAASMSTEDKVALVKGLFAHTHPDLSMGELFNLLLDMAIQQHPKTAAPRVSARQKPESKAGVRRAVFARDKNTCVNCKSQFATQPDHIVPRARGGKDTLENQRVLCRSCNQRAAIEVFGVKKMSRYLKSPAVRYGKRENRGRSSIFSSSAVRDLRRLSILERAYRPPSAAARP